jgi:hypothetical protein
MDSGSKFVLRKGALLYALSYKKPNDGTLRNLYFRDSGEALLSMFLWSDDGRFKNFELNIYAERYPLFLNVFFLQEDLILTPAGQGTNVDSVLQGSPTLKSLQAALDNDCALLAQDGFVFTYESRVKFLHKPPQPSNPREIEPGIDYDPHGLLTGRSTAYVICRENLLAHVQSQAIDAAMLRAALSEFADEWARERIEGPRPLSPSFQPEVRSYAQRRPLTVAALSNFIRERVRRDPEPILERTFLTPSAALSPSFSRESSPISPSLPKLGPVSPRSYQSVRLSQEGTFDMRSPGFSPIAPISPGSSSSLSPLSPFPPTAAPQGERISPSRPMPDQTDPFLTLPNDILFVMARDMNLDSLTRTCRTSKRFDKLMCNNEGFWREKVAADFPGPKVLSDPGDPNSKLVVDPYDKNNPLRRKPADWTWKRYYRELTGRIEEENALAFSELDDETKAALRNAPPLVQRERINQQRRAAGLGEIVYPPLANRFAQLGYIGRPINEAPYVLGAFDLPPRQAYIPNMERQAYLPNYDLADEEDPFLNQILQGADEADEVERDDGEEYDNDVYDDGEPTEEELREARLEGWPFDLDPTAFLDAVRYREPINATYYEANHWLREIFNELESEARDNWRSIGDEYNDLIRNFDRFFPGLGRRLVEDDRVYLYNRIQGMIIEMAKPYGYIGPPAYDGPGYVQSRLDDADNFLMGLDHSYTIRNYDVDPEIYKAALTDTREYVRRTGIADIWNSYPRLEDLTDNQRILYREIARVAARVERSIMAALYTQSALIHRDPDFRRAPYELADPRGEVLGYMDADNLRNFLVSRMLSPLLLQEAEQKGFRSQAQGEARILEANRFLWEYKPAAVPAQLAPPPARAGPGFQAPPAANLLIPPLEFQGPPAPFTFQGQPPAPGLLPAPTPQFIMPAGGPPQLGGYFILGGTANPPRGLPAPPTFPLTAPVFERQPPTNLEPAAEGNLLLRNLLDAAEQAYFTGGNIRNRPRSLEEENLYEDIIRRAGQNQRSSGEEYRLWLDEQLRWLRASNRIYPPPVLDEIRARFERYLLDRNPFGGPL